MIGTDQHLAQFNFGRLTFGFDDPRSSGFVDNLGRVNDVARRSDGFVWTWTADAATGDDNDGDKVFGGHPKNAWTLSVWDSVQALSRFVHKTIHGQFLARRAEWFDPIETPTYVLWPVAKGHLPSLAEGKARLDRLTQYGASPEAFDFKYASAHSATTEAV